MKTIIAIILILAAFKQDCGGYRWDVKTLSDKESKFIKWTPVKTNVKSLSQTVQVYPVDKNFNKSVRFGNEFNIYELKCRIKKYEKDESGNYNLTLVDLKDTSSVITGIIINPLCTNISKSNNFLGTFISTRSEFEKMTISQDKVKSGTYTLIGVYFSENSQIKLCPVMDLIQDFRN
jgi:hypothetical protein